jgi:hypothetical protein
MHLQTRTAIRLATCVSLALLAACPTPKYEPCDRPARQTLVFYDQSASSAADEPTTAIFREALREAVRDELQCPGDAVRGFQVHANTRGKAGRVDVVRTVPPLDTTAMSGMQKAQAKMRHQRDMQRLQAEGDAQLARWLSASVDPRLRAQTDLIGTLEVIRDALGRTEPDSTVPVSVLYLSDMHESMRSHGRRDFDQRPPASTAEAEAWADADAALLDQMQIDRARMNRVHVRLLLGNLANRDRAGPEIRRYWERLFEHAGIRHVEYN